MVVNRVNIPRLHTDYYMQMMKECASSEKKAIMPVSA